MAAVHPPARRPLGEALQSLRQKRGWSLREVERRSEGRIRSSHLSQVETGKVLEPSLSFLRELADVYGMDLKDFLEAIGMFDGDGGPLDSVQDNHLVLTYMARLNPETRQQAINLVRVLAGDQPVPPE